jgi:hypothetical protein
MTHRPGVLALLIPVLLASSYTVIAQNKDDKKKDEAQKKEIANIVKIVDDLTAGQPAPNDLGLSWLREDVLKAQGNKEYVPFTVQVDPSKVAGGNVAGRGSERQEGRQEQRQGQGRQEGLRLRGHQLRPGHGRPESDAHLAFLHRVRRHLRSLPRRQGADA